MARKKCFVISPIGQPHSPERTHADSALRLIIRPVLSAKPFNYAVKRADEFFEPEMISDRMFKEILDSDLIVADLTFLNPNVFYELAVSHMLKKRVIACASDNTPLPFDTSGFRTVRISVANVYKIEESRETLKRAILDTTFNSSNISNPLTNILSGVDSKHDVHANILSLDINMYTKISNLKQKTDSTSDLEVINRAIKIYNLILKMNEDGKEVFVRDKSNGKEETLLIV